jgi:hypothetical protein
MSGRYLEESNCHTVGLRKQRNQAVAGANDACNFIDEVGKRHYRDICDSHPLVIAAG